MRDDKIYLLAELTVLPGLLEEVKAILREALIPTLQARLRSHVRDRTKG